MSAGKLEFVLRDTRVMATSDYAVVHPTEDPLDALVEQVLETLGTDVELTVGGVTMHLAAWRDPDHWADDWREHCAEADPRGFVEDLLAGAVTPR